MSVQCSVRMRATAGLPVPPPTHPPTSLLCPSQLQDKIPIDLCQPCWSNSFRFTKEVLGNVY